MWGGNRARVSQARSVQYPKLGEENGGVCELTEPEEGICTDIDMKPCIH